MRGEQPSIPGGDSRSGYRWACYAICLVALIGCGEGIAPTERLSTTSEPPQSPIAADAGGDRTHPAETVTGAAEAKTPPALPRKIIYNAQVELVVESVSATADALARLIKQNGGYLAETDVLSYSQQRRQATWKVRIPVDRFDGFLAEVTRLGELQKDHLDSQDVTQEFYDLEARITNKQQEEKRLLKHLADSTGKLEDILAVERELSRVRGEIEQMQGRLRYLTNLSALSTVTITATELKDYTPPVSPTFRTQIGRTFWLSVARLADFSKAVVLLLVAAAPWLPVAALLALPAWVLLRHRRATTPARTRPERT